MDLMMLLLPSIFSHFPAFGVDSPPANSSFTYSVPPLI